MIIKGNGVAIALGGLALVVAMGGTAYAVSSSVNIADPNTPSNIAKVDSSGRLETQISPTVSTLAASANFQNAGTTTLTSPTRASLAITEMQVAETRLNGTVNGSDMFVQVQQVAATGGACTSTVLRTLFVTTLGSDQVIDLAPPVPLKVIPAATGQYCLVLSSVIDTGGSDATPHFPQYRFTGYVISGTYAGLGTPDAASRPATSDVKPGAGG